MEKETNWVYLSNNTRIFLQHNLSKTAIAMNSAIETTQFYQIGKFEVSVPC